MRFSDNNSLWTSWESYTTSKAWNIPIGDGSKTVFVQFRDNAGISSQSFFDDIILDTAPPTISITWPSNGAEVRSSSVTVNWVGVDAGSGVDHYEVRLDTGLWVSVTEQTYTFTWVSDGSHEVNVKAVDKIGREHEASVSFVVNTSPIGGAGYIEEAAIAVIAALIVGVLLLYVFRKRKKS
jgi:hypothetical protein